MSQINHWLSVIHTSHRGFVRTCWCQIRYLTGGYRKYRQPDWTSVERLIFVCKGNVCRSAYAEAVARSLGVDSISCGVDTQNGLPADEGAIRAAATKGVDLNKHRTTPIQSLTCRAGDLFVAMEPSQVEYLNQEFGGEFGSSLLGLWGRPVSPYIHDPYGTSSVYLDYCFNYIEKSVHEIARKISEAGRH